MNRPPRGDEEDWQCTVCRDTQFARNDKCRKCGAPRPSNDAATAALQNALLSSSRGGGAGAGALALNNSKEPANSDWSCPKCRDMNFGSRASCRSCHTPRPHNPMEALHRAVKGASTQSIAMLNGAGGAGVPSMGHASGAVGFIPAHANPVSSWQNMWNGETPNGMLVGEKLPDWMLAKPEDDGEGSSSDSDSGSSGSSSSGSGSGSGSNAEGDKEGKAKKGEGGKENKKKVPKSAAQKREERKRKAEAERERRKEQTDRRKKRIISLD